MDSLLKEYLILVGRDEEEIDYCGTWYFGDSKELADELFDLVIKGKKIATTSLYCLYEFENEEIPKENSFSVVTNYEGNKKCIIETKKVTVLPFSEVTREFAYKEGEGDKSLAYWQREHIKFFNRALEEYNKVFTEDMLVVCEEFECVYKQGEHMNKVAMLIIDMQNFLVDNKPFDIEIVLENIKSLASKCRENNVEVIYVQHEDLEDDGELKVGSCKWRIHKSVAPKENEIVISKNFNSSFRKTNLKEYLDKQGIKTLIITGMQTECCIDTTIRVAFEYEFNLIIPEKTNTTFDRETITGKEIYEYHNFVLFKDRFAKVESLDNVMKLIEEVKKI